MKKAFLFSFVSVIFFSAIAQVQSPQQFLGYKLGDRYSPHFKVVNYFKQVARDAPAMVKLEQYGETNEGRPLLLAFVSSAENLARLNDIRQNNLRLAGMAAGQPSSSDNTPAIVWLSYNVHGNETSSSEAAMLTLWELVNPANAKTKEWMKNVVVVIDPCINPDGRDRYVNWFNSVVGKVPNPQPISREHSEPWPGGRSNHYYFDLNRDWAWQTQIESQQRLARYNEWLPHIHVDFHEQGYNAPYYFAPAAEPFHEVITPWQREFQIMIGKNHAKYFDQNGWLFFTKERFDLFYPSYGDTYPIYKGSIGMTYEQGGHSRSGAAIINQDGDTLTLYDRLIHHYTTGMSTIEMASQNATKLVQEFKQFYDKAKTNPAGEFKAYLVKADEGDKIRRLKLLLDRNLIQYGAVNSGNFTGINYFTNKAESVKAGPGDIVINTDQPNSTLLKVLFERTSKLSDSATYDITAWSIPFAYGLTTYGLSAYVQGAIAPPGDSAVATTRTGTNEVAAAYLIKWNGLNAARFLAGALRQGIKVRYAEQPFKVQSLDFEKGTLIISRTGNRGLGSKLPGLVDSFARDAGIAYYPVASTFVDKGFDFGSDKVHIIKKPRITLVAGEGVSALGMGEIWHLFDREINYPVNIVWAEDFDKVILRETDVLILPDGNYKFISDKAMNDAIKEWVNGGGRLITLERATGQLSRNDWGIKLKTADEKKDDKKEEKKDNYDLLHRYEDRERDFLTNFIPGSIYKVEIDNSHPLAFGYPDFYYTLKQDDNIYEFIKEGGWNVGVIKKDAQIAGFVGSKLREKLRDGLLFGVQDMGRGEVVYLADNPLFRSFWENGKLLFCNAVFLVGQ